MYANNKNNSARRIKTEELSYLKENGASKLKSMNLDKNKMNKSSNYSSGVEKSSHNYSNDYSDDDDDYNDDYKNTKSNNYNREKSSGSRIRSINASVVSSRLKPSSSNNQNSKSKSPSRRKSLAKERWDILKEAILNKKASIQRNSKASVRRFDSYGFVKCVKIAYNNTTTNNNNYSTLNANKYNKDVNSDYDDDDDVHFESGKSVSKSNKSRSDQTNQAPSYQWFNVTVPSIDANEAVKVRFYNGSISLNELVGFNNTGNICLWPSEEIMTYFCAKNSMIFDNKSVCELGGGMTCLGGLMISKFSQPKEVFLTDGNEASFENLEVICSENEFECSVECCLLQWNKETNYGDLENRFDYIICADCLFFDEFREDLCATIYRLLKLDGTCLIFAPNRQNTFHKFVDLAKLHFECMIVHDYDMEIWEKHLYEKENNPDYDEDIHYPLLLKLKKRTRATNDFCKMVL